MQTDGAYVDQIAPGAKPPATSPTPLKIVPNTGPVTPRTPPAGLYVQLVSASSQEDALKAGLELSARLGSDRPAFIQGVATIVDGQPRILLFGGPFADASAAQRFCGLALAGAACQARMFGGSSLERARPAPGPKQGDRFTPPVAVVRTPAGGSPRE